MEAGSEAEQPKDGRIKGRTCAAVGSVVFAWVSGAFPHVARLSAQCAMQQPRYCICFRFPTLRMLRHDRRGRLPHPARPHPLAPRPARQALHRAGARRRPEGRRLHVAATGRISAASALTLRPRPARQRPGQPPAHQPLARRRHQGARRPPSAPAARRSPPISTICAARASPGTARRRACSVPRPTNADGTAFAERCEDDRHHFRFIVSPEDAVEMTDLKAFTRDLMGQMEKDLGTQARLGRPSITGTPTIRTSTSSCAACRRRRRTSSSRATTSAKACATRAQRSGHAGARSAHRSRDPPQPGTARSRPSAGRGSTVSLSATPVDNGVIDLAPRPDRQPDDYPPLKVGRLRKLETLGLAAPARPRPMDRRRTRPRRRCASSASAATSSSACTAPDRARASSAAAASYVLAGGEPRRSPIIGRLVDRGLDDELTGTAYAVVDGIDGRTHHIKLPDLDAAGDSAPGSIVELRQFDDAQRPAPRRARRPLRSRHRRAGHGVGRDLARPPGSSRASPMPLGDGGFGAEVRDAMDGARRTSRRAGSGAAAGPARSSSARPARHAAPARAGRARREARRRDGPALQTAASGEYVAGTYRQRLTLASGRFAMIDDGLGFQLVPWSPALEKQSRPARLRRRPQDGGGIDWSFGRKRGLGL